MSIFNEAPLKARAGGAALDLAGSSGTTNNCIKRTTMLMPNNDKQIERIVNASPQNKN
jgi:hypothetical protein